MERLTLKLKKPTQKGFEYVGVNGANAQKVLKKLGELEDLEEQGLLLKLPCKIGDTVYRFWYTDGIPYKVQPVKIRTLSNLVAMMEGDEFDKTVFLTKAEAEKALAEMEK